MPLLFKTWHFLLKINAIIIPNKIYSIILVLSSILFIFKIPQLSPKHLLQVQARIQ